MTELDASDAVALDLKRVYRGAAQVRAVLAGVVFSPGDGQVRVRASRRGERVIMLLDLTMRGRATGIEVPLGQVAWISTFKDGLGARVKLYMSQSEALEAGGLSE